jgi:hypothetical protein
MVRVDHGIVDPPMPIPKEEFIRVHHSLFPSFKNRNQANKAMQLDETRNHQLLKGPKPKNRQRIFY